MRDQRHLSRADLGGGRVEDRLQVADLLRGGVRVAGRLVRPAPAEKVRKPLVPASRSASRASRDLPMPASPEIATTCARPSAARLIASARVRNSAARPTNGSGVAVSTTVPTARAALSPSGLAPPPAPPNPPRRYQPAASRAGRLPPGIARPEQREHAEPGPRSEVASAVGLSPHRRKVEAPRQPLSKATADDIKGPIRLRLRGQGRRDHRLEPTTAARSAGWPTDRRSHAGTA